MIKHQGFGKVVFFEKSFPLFEEVFVCRKQSSLHTKTSLTSLGAGFAPIYRDFCEALESFSKMKDG